MLIAYDSRTGNVRRFVKKLDLPSIQITPEMTLDQPFILVTYTTGFGQVPDKVMSFLKANHSRLKGVVASGNRNWGDGFAKSADRISELYSVPVLGKFELSGTQRDVESLQQEVSLVAAYRTEQFINAAR
ncbi:MAG: class Ib ribonucleoside-diphosphate reductase assembly flavoprotein NrdI [Candidatus Cohnella colombiensis]|uniref:Protein NrdI n=1 Tax=Candidatus Cohnella colombiensis TaxID=3121368 RepID=A0AA95EYT1_9BACL|nr:MAG: class Ib ribonucleoside-diphosphate reductase assembly flavoprotein NrdI [Cohnella sp.]